MKIIHSVNTIITNTSGKYLLQMRDGTLGICNPLKWNFFGGTIEEDDIQAAAAREMEEELAIKAEPTQFEKVGELTPKEGSIVHIVRYKYPVEWHGITVQEGAGAGFFTKDEILKIPITDATRKIVENYL